MNTVSNEDKTTESFLDKHITVIVCLSSFVPGIIAINFLLGILNFHGKKREIMKGLIYTILLAPVAVALIMGLASMGN